MIRFKLLSPGYRPESVTLVTTLLDPRKYPTQKIARLYARRRKIELLEVIARDQVPERPDRLEPRAVKHRPKPYQLLNRPRQVMKEIAHRSKYRENDK